MGILVTGIKCDNKWYLQRFAAVVSLLYPEKRYPNAQKTKHYHLYFIITVFSVIYYLSRYRNQDHIWWRRQHPCSILFYINYPYYTSRCCTSVSVIKLSAGTADAGWKTQKAGAVELSYLALRNGNRCYSLFNDSTLLYFLEIVSPVRSCFSWL